MIDREVRTELTRQLDQMTREQQERVLQFARTLRGPKGGKLPRFDRPMLRPEEAQQMLEDIRESEQYAAFPAGLPGRDLLEFAGMLSPEEADKMRRDIEETCEQAPPG
jgi:hypothetical protein